MVLMKVRPVVIPRARALLSRATSVCFCSWMPANGAAAPDGMCPDRVAAPMLTVGPRATTNTFVVPPVRREPSELPLPPKCKRRYDGAVGQRGLLTGDDAQVRA